MRVKEDKRVFGYEISESGILISVNPEWLAFASENGAHELGPDSVLGRPLWKFIAGSEVRHLYHAILNRLKVTAGTLNLPYRCDSPDCRRLLNMQVFYIPARQTYRFESRILSSERRKPISLLEPSQTHGGELLNMCSWCKKIMLDSSNWVEPELAIQSLKLFECSTLPYISHGVCPNCKEHISKELRSL